LEKLKQNHDVAVAWRSFELRPKGSPPLPPEYRDYIENVGRPRFVEIARAQYGLTINSGPFGIDSRPALLGAKYAEAQGAGDAYHQAVFHSYWLHGQSIADRAMLRTIAQACGLDGDEFWDALDAEEVNLAVSTDIAQAQMLGINSVPALVFEKQYLVSGAQPYEVLVQVVEKLNREAARKS
jgi:predicted DsbA family dithiol-disulfide isomerase